MLSKNYDDMYHAIKLSTVESKNKEVYWDWVLNLYPDCISLQSHSRNLSFGQLAMHHKSYQWAKNEIC